MGATDGRALAELRGYYDIHLFVSGTRRSRIDQLVSYKQIFNPSAWPEMGLNKSSVAVGVVASRNLPASY